MYRYLKSVLVTVLTVAGVAASFASPVRAQEEISVGVLQYVEHESLNQTYEGFKAGLEEAGYIDGQNLKINFLNAAGDNANLQSMSETLRANDYLFAIATPAAQGLSNIVKDKPIYFSAVTDPVASGLVTSLEQPGANVTGTIDAGPVEKQIELLQSIAPEAKKIGLIYNSGETNSQVEAEKAMAIMKEKGLDPVEATVTSTNDVSQVIGSVANQVDALFTVTDNTIASAMTLVGDIAIDAGIPLIGGSKDMALENGLATYGLDYYELGKQTAQMLVRQINENLETKDIPVETAAKLELVVNKTVAEKLGIDPNSIQAPE
ncbi:ABC transporter substrate-binding protein [Hutsoniella sourekii]|uniref:ABC transporter substrate-binding protein n=1 Tax=Hutsoniella sourekii TaxID=87650 RepID=UPI0004809EE8|nr:ABC transporter substrate-binding protein [Hutsoniella sourekii]